MFVELTQWLVLTMQDAEAPGASVVGKLQPLRLSTLPSLVLASVTVTLFKVTLPELVTVMR